MSFVDDVNVDGGSYLLDANFSGEDGDVGKTLNLDVTVEPVGSSAVGGSIESLYDELFELGWLGDFSYYYYVSSSVFCITWYSAKSPADTGEIIYPDLSCSVVFNNETYTDDNNGVEIPLTPNQLVTEQEFVITFNNGSEDYTFTLTTVPAGKEIYFYMDYYRKKLAEANQQQ